MLIGPGFIVVVLDGETDWDGRFLDRIDQGIAHSKRPREYRVVPAGLPSILHRLT
jgi:hypothetical protein